MAVFLDIEDAFNNIRIEAVEEAFELTVIHLRLKE